MGFGWSVDSPQFRLYHTWVLVPERGGTRVTTEEAQKVVDLIRFRFEQPNTMHDGSDWWMSALKARPTVWADDESPSRPTCCGVRPCRRVAKSRRYRPVTTLCLRRRMTTQPGVDARDGISNFRGDHGEIV